MKIILILLLVFSLMGCTRSQAKTVSTWAGGLEREWSVNSAQNQIYSYEYFFNMYATIEGSANSIKYLDPEKDRIEINGIKMNLSKWISDYNANSLKVESRARFKDGNQLPDQLSLKDFGL